MWHPFTTHTPLAYDTTARSSVCGAFFFIRRMEGFWERLIGLMFRKNLEAHFAMLFPHTKSIHTFGMRFNIDIVFLDGNNKVTKILYNIPPLRICIGPFQTKHTLEMKAGSAIHLDIVTGGALNFQPAAEMTNK